METKSKVIQVRVEPSDYQKIVYYAVKRRKKPSSMVRDMILDWLAMATDQSGANMGQEQ